MESNNDICEKCLLYFDGLDEQQINEKIKIIYGNLSKMKPEYIMWFGPHKNRDIRESVNDKKFAIYLLGEYHGLGECPLKLGIREILMCTSDNCQS
jgi:hypothetical protein